MEQVERENSGHTVVVNTVVLEHNVAALSEPYYSSQVCVYKPALLGTRFPELCTVRKLSLREPIIHRLN